MKKLLILFFMIFISCYEDSNIADTQQSTETEKLMQEANAQVGMPAIKNFYEKKLMKMLYEIRDKANLKTYAYIQCSYTGKFLFLGESIGFGIPASVQYSNPQKLVHTDLGDSRGNIPLPQPEPNGLYMPEGLSATYIMLINPKTGEPEPVYIEQEILVSPFPLPDRLVL